VYVCVRHGSQGKYSNYFSVQINWLEFITEMEVFIARYELNLYKHFRWIIDLYLVIVPSWGLIQRWTDLPAFESGCDFESLKLWMFSVSYYRTSFASTIQKSVFRHFHTCSNQLLLCHQIIYCCCYWCCWCCFSTVIIMESYQNTVVLVCIMQLGLDLPIFLRK